MFALNEVTRFCVWRTHTCCSAALQAFMLRCGTKF